VPFNTASLFPVGCSISGVSEVEYRYVPGCFYIGNLIASKILQKNL